MRPRTEPVHTQKMCRINSSAGKFVPSFTLLKKDLDIRKCVFAINCCLRVPQKVHVLFRDNEGILTGNYQSCPLRHEQSLVRGSESSNVDLWKAKELRRGESVNTCSDGSTNKQLEGSLS